ALICGGIGMGARMALADAGIRLYAGVQGPADAAAKALAEGKLEYDPDVCCDRHGQHGGGCDHHHDGEEGHRFGDEECSRRRGSGECGQLRHEHGCGHGQCREG
ncbi:MAG: DNA-binding protein, partial [Clostridia bacterium]|nr:DNA-binding protein [Clostridia bacterium]